MLNVHTQLYNTCLPEDSMTRLGREASAIAVYVIDKPSPVSVFTCKRQDSSNGKSRRQSLKEFSEELSSVLNNIGGGFVA